MLKRLTIIAIAITALACDLTAQESQNSGVRRRDPAAERGASSVPSVSERAQNRYGGSGNLTDADVQWMRVIYRQLDLNDDKNAALYFPEDPIDGQENLFRIIMRLLCDGDVKAYEYLDGREIFTDKYEVKMSDVFDRFHIPYTQAKGSTEKNQKFAVDETDVPTNEVLSYYVIERWEFDTRNNRMRTYVDAICPVLHRAGDFGGDAVKYPMFWVKFGDLRPYLAQQQIFVSDDNNLPTCNYDDFFNLTMYNGEIYKTRNLKNQSLMQMYPDPDDLKHVQDSIQNYLANFENKLWVPDREEVLARREAEANKEAEPTLEDIVAAPAAEASAVEATAKEDKRTVRGSRTSRGDSNAKNNKKKAKQPKVSKPKASSSSAARSVRRKR